MRDQRWSWRRRVKYRNKEKETERKGRRKLKRIGEATLPPSG